MGSVGLVAGLRTRSKSVSENIRKSLSFIVLEIVWSEYSDGGHGQSFVCSNLSY